MPLAQYRLQAEGRFHQAAFPTPKQVSDLDAWLVCAIRALRAPDLPVRVYLGRPYADNGWVETDRNVSETAVRFDFQDSLYRKCVIIINRQFQQLGART